MRLFPREVDRLLLRQAAELARSRHKKGLCLSEPEARALIADAICEGAHEGGTVSGMVSLGASLLSEDDVMPGVPERIDVVMVEAFFPDGQKLVCVHDPIGPGTSDSVVPLRPRWQLGDRPVEVNSGRDTKSLEVQSTADRPIQVGSHYHFFEVNPALHFDRIAAYGFRLDIPAGTTLRFEPGDVRKIDLVAIGGARKVHGLAGLVNGSLDDPNVYSTAKSRLLDFLQE
ncbi:MULTISPECIES: urease subunit beta [Vreelandella]|nr:urease subunit beta [Halomonas meridiana]